MNDNYKLLSSTPLFEKVYTNIDSGYTRFKLAGTHLTFDYVFAIDKCSAIKELRSNGKNIKAKTCIFSFEEALEVLAKNNSDYIHIFIFYRFLFN